MPRTAKPENLGPNRWRIDHAGKRRSKLYTSFDAAQRALRAHQATTDEIRHGLRPKPPEDHTFDELATYWEAHVLRTKRSRKDDMSIVRAQERASKWLKGWFCDPSVSKREVSNANVSSYWFRGRHDAGPDGLHEP